MATFFGKICPLGWPYVIFVICIFVILVVLFHFGFEGRIQLVLIVHVRGHCSTLTFYLTPVPSAGTGFKPSIYCLYIYSTYHVVLLSLNISIHCKYNYLHIQIYSA